MLLVLVGIVLAPFLFYWLGSQLTSLWLLSILLRGALRYWWIAVLILLAIVPTSFLLTWLFRKKGKDAETRKQNPHSSA